VIIALVLVKQPHRRLFFWGFTWFLLFLSHLNSGSIFLEHRAYCALIGVFFALTQLRPIQDLDLSKMPYVADSV